MLAAIPGLLGKAGAGLSRAVQYVKPALELNRTGQPAPANRGLVCLARPPAISIHLFYPSLNMCLSPTYATLGPGEATGRLPLILVGST